MKKRIVSLIALLLCAVFVLGSCGANVKTADFNDVFDAEAFELEASLKTKTDIAELNDATLNGTAGDFALFKLKDETTGEAIYKVYNIETGAFVLTLTDSATLKYDVAVLETWDESCVIVVAATENTGVEKITAKLYDATGAEIAAAEVTEEEEKDLFAMVADLVLFDDVYYRTKDGALTKFLDKSPLAKELPEFDTWTDKYYYSFAGDKVEVYAADTLKLATVCYAASKCDRAPEYFVLESGDILMQEYTRLPDDAKNYDVLEAEKKFSLETFIFDVEDGEKNKIDFEFKVTDVIRSNDPMNDLEVEMAEFENIFTVQPFIDKYEETNELATMLLLVDNKGGVDGSISGYLPVTNTEFPVQIAADRYLLTDVCGNCYLLDAKGEIIGEANADDYNSKYLIAGGKIFDLSLAEVYDLDANEYVVEGVLVDTILLSKTNDEGKTEYAIFNNGSVTTLIGNDKGGNAQALGNYIAGSYTADGKTVYAIYATDGTVIASSESAISPVCGNDTATIFKTTLTNDEGKSTTVYYRVTK